LWLVELVERKCINARILVGKFRVLKDVGISKSPTIAPAFAHLFHVTRIWMQFGIVRGSFWGRVRAPKETACHLNFVYSMMATFMLRAFRCPCCLARILLKLTFDTLVG